MPADRRVTSRPSRRPAPAPVMHTERRISPPALARLLGRPAGGGPAYAWLADAVRRCVLDGTLPLSSRLPSERELADALGVSRTTTAAAYERLREQGLLLTRRGSGSVTTLPGGPVEHGGRLAPWPDGPGAPVDLTMAAPAAPPELHLATQRAVEQLPRHLPGPGYTHLGLVVLRETLAARLTARGTPTEPDEVLVTAGAQQAIHLLVGSMVSPGDRVVVEHPGYPNALEAVRASGARPVPVPVGAAGLDLELLDATVRSAAPRLVLLTPDHHNPTGTSLDAAAREQVRRLATHARTPVVADETLVDLTFDGTRAASLAGAGRPGQVLVVGSASKTFWGGLRLGWVRGPRDLVARLATERVHQGLGPPVLDQLVLVELLRLEEALLTVRREQLRRRRDVLLGALAAALPWTVPVPAGGLSAWVDLGAPVSSALATLAPDHGVRITPGPVFGVDGSFENRLRLPFCAPEDLLVRGVEGLAATWAALGSPPGGGAPRVGQSRRAPAARDELVV